MIERPSTPHLRLVWSRPASFTDRRRIDLSRAIEIHLEGRDGLTDEQFVYLYATGHLPHLPRPA